jgi:uncharacterized membrane protein YkvA (DUF1232 family)
MRRVNPLAAAAYNASMSHATGERVYHWCATRAGAGDEGRIATMNVAGNDGELGSFTAVLERRVAAWLASPEAERFPCAFLYRHLPDLFLLLAELSLDPTVDARERTAVRSALKYIVAPFDLIPEGFVGTAGYRDDLVLAAYLVERLGAAAGADALSARWHRDGDPLAIARTILDAASDLVGGEICERLRTWAPA